MQDLEKKIKLYSTIGPRATFGMHCLNMVKENSNLMVLTADVSTSAGLDRYRKTFPENYVEVGIAEQNMIGIATGLTNEGYDVITTTFAPFQTLRCCEQIKVNLAYMKKKVVMVGLASGLVLGTLGYTHCCIEDIGVLRSIPEITIISPSDSFELCKSLDAAIKYDKSVYIRLTGGTNNPIINKADYEFNIGKSIEIKKGNQLTLFASGSSVYQALEAAISLEKKNVSCSVINMHTIKPIDEESIIKAINNSSLIVSVEEHNIIGGLGSAISEVMAQQSSSVPLLKLGINDQYSKGGTYNFLLEKHGLNSEKIVEAILKKI